MKNFKIGKHLVGENHKPFVIAEIGINHMGNYKLCKKMVIAACKCGASAIKLQTINEDESYMSHTSSYKIFKNKNLSDENLLKLKLITEKYGLEFFTTPGDISSLNRIKKLGMKAIKISSGLMTNLPLVEESIKTRLPLIISLGMAYEKEILKIKKLLDRYNHKKYVFLKCTAEYPTADSFVNISSMGTIKEKFKSLVGYSDHTLDDLACLHAVSLGAVVIEKHFTTDTNIKGADNKISMLPKDFKLMISKINRILLQKGNLNISPTKKEVTERLLRHRYFVASCNIQKGDKFSLKNLNMKRVTNANNAIKSYDKHKLLDKKSKTNIKVGEVILTNYV